MSEDAIQEDVSENVEAPELSGRDKQMKDVVDAYQEYEGRNEVNTTESATPESDPYESLGYYANNDGQLVTKLKVNGVEKEVTADQLRAYAQKDITADQRLQQAAEYAKQLSEREALLNQRAQEMESQQNPVDIPPVDLKQSALQAIKKMYDGDDEDAAEALALMVQGVKPQPVSEKDIEALVGKQVDNKLALQQQQVSQQQWNDSLTRGLQEFETQYSDIAQDANLASYANMLTQRMMEQKNAGKTEYVNKTPEDMIREAAEQTRQFRDSLSGNQSSQRAENKARLHSMPHKRSTQFQKPIPEDVDDSPMAVVERMRNQRAII